MKASVPNLCPFRGPGDAATFLARLHIPRLKKFIAANKHKLIFKRFTAVGSYEALIEAFFNNKPGARKLFEQTAFAHNGDYRKLATYLMTHGA